MSAWAAAAAVLVLATLVRAWVSRQASAALQVDQWFWQAYASAARSQRRVPPSLPQYLLDEQQWYPPLFPLLLTALGPERLRRSGGLAMALDLLRLALVMWAASALTGGDAAAVGAAGLAYALAPLVVLYNAQLNPRGPGALLLDASVLLAAWSWAAGPRWAWPAAALAAALVLLTHKMTAQLLAFLCLAAAALGSLRVALLLPAAVLLALVLSAGFYAKVLRAHADIVSFWHRNWRWLQCDPIRESPVYGDPGHDSAAKLHGRGFAGAVRHLRRFAGLQPGVWLLALLVGTRALPLPGPTSRLVAIVLGLELLFAAMTTFVPWLRALGAGSLYLFNAAFPAALLWGLLVAAEPLARPALAVALAADALVLGLRARGLARARASSGEGWDELVEHLRASERAPTLCLPQNLYDELAERTGQPVLWGAHGYGFRRLEPLFPRLMLPFADVRASYGMRRLVAREGALNERAEADLPAPARVFGRYRVYEWPEPESSSR